MDPLGRELSKGAVLMCACAELHLLVVTFDGGVVVWYGTHICRLHTVS